jgi:hypothetical protein
MKILALFSVTVLAFVFACGGGNAKHESSMVQEGSDMSPNCCCKTIPQTAEKEIVPVYAQAGRMECSGQHGDCVDDVQCNGQGSDQQTGTGTNDGVPPPPPVQPSTDSSGIQ